MSGHSKWHSIKHKKGKEDAKRGKLFTKLIKEVMVAARCGGGDPEGNARLRTAINNAKANNMPQENIERAIKKGTGELEGVKYEEVTYEGYGPGGVAILINAMTDNKNRAVADIRYIFSKSNGNLGENGCVSWMFEQKGLIVFDRKTVEEEKLIDIALDAGAQDVADVEEDGVFEVYTSPSDFEEVKVAFDKSGLKYTVAEITMLPQSYIKLEGKEAQQMLKLMDLLEDHEEVQNDFDIPKEVMEKL
jgi:YebC/PmpR family DNA-binding regulatory protein